MLKHHDMFIEATIRWMHFLLLQILKDGSEVNQSKHSDTMKEEDKSGAGVRVQSFVEYFD